MKRVSILLAVLLCGCDPMANNMTGNVKVNTIVADNGVPCVLAVGGGSGGLAISCDWSEHHSALVPH